MYGVAAAGRGVIVSENFASLKGLHLGHAVELETPTGRLRLPVAGVVADWSDQQGAIFLDRTVYEQRWNDDRVNTFRVYVARDSSPAAVRQAILDRLGTGRRLFVLTNQEVRSYITGLTDQWLALAYMQTFIGVLVAVLGIMNTLTVSIMDRRRELGVLRAVGAGRWQVRQTIWIEAMTIGLVGIVLGLAESEIAQAAQHALRAARPPAG